MSEILFIAHRIPFPPDRGDKIRSHNVLKHLADLAPVHVATFADDALDYAEEGALAAVAASHCLVHRSKPLALAAAEAMVTGKPISLTAFHSRALADYIRTTLKTRPISTIYGFSGQMGQYVPQDFQGRVIADFVDVDSAKFEAYAKRDGGLKGWAENREARLLRAEEARFAGRADVSLLISDEEAALFRLRSGGAARVCTLPNGIDNQAFDPGEVRPEPQLAELPYPRLIFTGQMDYAPNVDACVRAVTRILPRIREAFPQASFHIVGRNPAERLSALASQGVHVWGRVPEVQPWLAASDLALVPLEIGRGVQNKVLEAMAMALPVVLTPEAATGIGARDGAQLSIASDDDALAAACIALLQDLPHARSMGRAAREYVVGHASWSAALADLTQLAGYAPMAARDVA
ncbi:sugar transferase (PEP-CTERM/EpsH1 system associated) [Novosphingobium chloroacetimidivorans]|uniref:Sugar transferase (PEP-CTERM/EpsH1 system associated) n=1 Tax=Novosphingobium chloroacetimidivorans TaxID=1428314 RepID=A0A7W7K949_9SPHN|nr:TIGR03087 family PEP-CTERM/XrtA system glycosyltransferase [Novosphingobium chloroacetimidivorans]MBB4858524.1 sugar transferase (PEP-CTERM/EpsH1 system associated) [Novosphingobium chloroacetimidivorans]